MNRPGLFAALVLLSLLVACSGRAAGGYPESGRYRINDRDIDLVEGEYSDIDGSVSIAGSARGDIDGDGNGDLVVALVRNSRGSGVFYYLNVLTGDASGGFRLAGEAFLGDRIGVDDVSIDPARSGVRVQLRVRADDQPYAAQPELDATRHWRLADGALVEFDPRAERAARLLLPFKKDLKAALLEGLADGPSAAIDACKLEAPVIAARLSTDGVAVGRSSHRLRNPANTAPGWVSPILEQYLADTDDRAPRTVELDRGRVGYVEPIALAPLCATCHGSAIAPDVASRIAALYPEDQATGFEVGELRGVFWVEFPLRE